MTDQDPTQSAASDTQGLFFSSDYIIKTLTLITSDSSAIDLRPIMLELDIFEDVFAPSMTGKVRIGDAGDIPSNFKLHGNEYLNISIDKPTLNKPLTKTFRVYKLGDRDFGTNSLQNYTLYFCSEEMILSTQILISKSYKGLTVDKMINDILLNKLKTNSSKIANMATVTGNYDIIIPMMQPFEAISWLLPRAYNNNQNLFFFFENRDGYNFISYEQLLMVPSYATYSRSVKTSTKPDETFNSFNYIKVMEDYNIMKAMRYGCFSSSLLTLDIINRTYTSMTFSVNQLANSATLNSTLAANKMTNRLGKTLYDVNENMVKYVISRDSDPSMNPIRNDSWLPQTASRLAQLQSFKTVITIPGDILLKAGSIINIIMPKMQPQTQAASNDSLRTGRAFVSSVHHKFIQNKCSTILEILQDTVNAPLLQAATTSSALQQVTQQ